MMPKIICPDCSAENLSNAKYCSRCGNVLPTAAVEIPADNIQQSKSQPASKKKRIFSLIISAIAFIVSYYAVQQLFFKPPSYDKVMMAAASELNKTCPIMVDQETRLDNVIALPENTFQYNYTLVNVEKSQINPDTVKKIIEPGIINNVKTSPDLKIYRDNKTTMNYNYRDKNGVFVLKISVTPDLYK